MATSKGSREDLFSQQENTLHHVARFPRQIEEAIHQASDSTICALDHGVSRLNVQLHVSGFDIKLRPDQAGNEIMYFLNHLGSILIQRGFRINFIFNSMFDVANARRLLREDIEQNVKLNVLGIDHFNLNEDIAVLVCPSNEGNENLGRIEAVERLLYSGPPASVISRKCRQDFLQRPIIMINPSLEAIHAHSSTYRKVVPMFMSDFEMTYYLDPHLMDRFGRRGRNHAALLKAYPAKEWQLWKRSGKMEEFELVWQRSQRPTDADLSCFLMTDLDFPHLT